MAARTQPPPKDVTGFVVAGSGVAALLTLAAGLPGALVLWVGLLVAAFMAPAPVLTGKEGKPPRPVPSGPGEAKAMRTYRIWADLRWRLMVPTVDWLPGWPVFASWAGAVGAGVAVSTLQVRAGVPGWVAGVNALAAFVVVAQVSASRRRFATDDDRSPGVRFSTLADWVRSGVLARIVAGAAVCAGVVLAASIFLLVTDSPVIGGLWGTAGELVVAAISGPLLALAIVAGPWTAHAMTPWRELVAARAQWKPRWQQVGIKDDAPFLVKREQVGPATVETFDAPPSSGAASFFTAAIAAKITTSLGTNMRVSVLETPNLDGSGQPVPGSVHPVRFDVVVFPSDQWPNLAEPSLDENVARLMIRAAVADTCDRTGYARYLLTDMVRVSDHPQEIAEHSRSLWSRLSAPLKRKASASAVDADETAGVLDDEEVVVLTKAAPDDRDEPAGSPATIWATGWANTAGLGANILRHTLRDQIAASAGVQVLVDHRSRGGAGAVFFGPASNPAVIFDPAQGITTAQMVDLEREDEWRPRWAAALKQDANAPKPELALYKELPTAMGTIFYQPFVTLNGEEPGQYFGLETKLKATLNGAPFLSITGFATAAERPGERHAQAFAVAWSASPMPAGPHSLAPQPRPARSYEDVGLHILAGRMNEAFKAARLAQPEVASAQCLTKPSSRGHIWATSMRLHGGVTLSDVRGQVARIRTTLGSPWLRVAAAEDGCVIFAGERPEKVELVNERRDRQRLVALDWEQAFLDSKVSGVGGLLPKLTATDVLPRNDKVQVLDFDLPSGLAISDIKAATEKLKTSTGNAFIEVRPGPAGPSTVRLLVCEVNPLPDSAPYDFIAIDKSTGIPFATGIDGDEITYNPRVDPHLLVAGASGGGKAQPLCATLPVPVSERFPTGWATNGELVEGDLVYAADGTTTRVVGFSETSVEPVYEVRFGDGQVVRAGASHLWKVSTAESRQAWTTSKTARRSARHDQYTARATGLRSLAAKIGVGTSAPLADIARLAGYSELSLHQMSLPIEHLVDVVALPSNKKSRQYEMSAVAAWLARSARRSGGSTTFAGTVLSVEDAERLGQAGAWMTTREMADTLLGRAATRSERDLAKQVVRRAQPEHRDGHTTFATNVYPVDEVLTMLADRIDTQALGSDSGVVVRDLEVLMTTEQMLAQPRFVSAGGARDTVNFAVRLAQAIDGPTADLPVDPYVMGAWLGDGASRCGQVAQDPYALDAEGISDQERMRAELEAHHPGTHKIASSPYVLSVPGLSGGLRASGVFGRKHIPAAYLRASRDQRLALLQGLMDTDGTINAEGTCEIDLCDQDLADGMLELVRSLGIRVSQRSGPARITEADPDRPGHTRQRTTSTRYRLKFATDLPVFRLPRKAARLPQALRQTQQWNYVESITVHDPEPMRCIKVDHPEHLFLVEGFVPTHNSVTLQAIIYGALIRGWDVYVADPTKGAADFKFAMPYSKAMTVDPFEAAAMMKAVYAEVVRRKNLNSQYGVGNYRDLPEDVRPAHMLVVIDEFTSLMGQDTVPKPSDDPEMDAERELIVAGNQAKTEIGVYTGKCAREARSAGLTLVLATQKLAAALLDTIPGAGDLKVNLSRMLLGKATNGDRMSALRAPFEAPELGDSVPPGRGLWETTEGAAKVMQAWYDPREQAVLAEELASRIDTLDEDERLDFSSFVTRPSDEQEAPGPRRRARKAAPVEQVVELAPIVLTLEDLVEDDSAADAPGESREHASTDDDGFRDLDMRELLWGEQSVPEPDLSAAQELTVVAVRAPHAPIAPEVPAAVEDVLVNESAVVFLDIDGVLAPMGPSRAWPDMETIKVKAGHVLASRTALAQAGRLPARVVWASDWEDSAQPSFGPLIGRPDAEYLSPNAEHENFGWWKIGAAHAWLASHPEVTRAVWIDDRLQQTDELGVEHAETIREVLASVDVQVLSITPEPMVGLTAADLASARDFLAGPAAEVEAAPAAPSPQVEPVPVEQVRSEPEPEPDAPVRSEPELEPAAPAGPQAPRPARVPKPKTYTDEW